MTFAVAAVIVASALTGGSVWKYQEYKYVAKDAARIEAENIRLNTNEEVAEAAATKHEVNKTKIATKYVVVTEAIENVITKIEYRDRVCFDDDGLRAHASAVKLTHPSSKSENSLPTAPVP